MNHLRNFRKPEATGTAVLIVALGAVTTMREEDWPRSSWWDPGSVGRLIYVVLSIATGLASLYVAIAFRRLLGRRDRTRVLFEAAHGFAKVVEQNTDLRDGEFGVNIWLVKGPIGFRRLAREAFAAPHHAETPVTWTKNKGVIGEAWGRRTPRFADLDRVRKVLQSRDLFCAMPPESRFCLTWDEFSETGRYHSVLAVPLRRHRSARHTVRGVVAIDALVSDKRLQIKTLPQLPEFDRVRRTCEAAIGSDEGSGTDAP